MAEPIEIIIRKGQSGDGTGFGVPSMKQDESVNNTRSNTNNTDFIKKIRNIPLVAFAIGTVRKEINYGISQYGNITGNYIGQAAIEYNLSILHEVTGVISSSVAGAMMTGSPWGALVYGGIAIGNIGINRYNEWRTLQTNIAKLNTYANIMQERSGNMYNNGSRGTEQ